MTTTVISKKLIDFAQGLQQMHGEGRFRLSVIFSSEERRLDDLEAVKNETPTFVVVKAENKTPVKFLKGAVASAISKDHGVLLDYRGFVSADLKMLLDDLSLGRVDIDGEQMLTGLSDGSFVLIIDYKYFDGSGLMKYFSSYCKP